MEFKDLLVEHDYYCSDSSYFKLGFETNYKTFQDFYDDMGNADLDMNLVFRFDISKNEEDDTYFMEIFIIHQRKGRFVPFFIESVKESDFELIKSYLEPRFKHLKNLWKPFN